MKKILLLVFMAAFALQQAVAQSAKTTPPPKGPSPTPEQLKLKPWPFKTAVPPAKNIFDLPPANYQPVGPLTAPGRPAAEAIETVRGENGLPIFFRGCTAVSQTADAGKPVGTRALEYLASVQPVGIAAPAQEFVVRRANQDTRGDWHVRLDQVYQGVPVYGGELIAHTKNGIFELLNGRYFPTPRVASVVPSVLAETAVQRVVQQIGAVKTNWSAEDRRLVGGKETQAELVVYHHRHDLDAERLAWHVVIYPDLMHRKVYFVDAHSGAVIHHFDHTCSINGSDTCTGHEHDSPAGGASGGPITASGLDLKNVSRSFGAWMEGATNYLEDASQPMFNPGASQMPSSPVGVIVTLDAQNTSPEVQSTFKYSLVTSGTMIFGDKKAVSTHWNAIESYKYYLAKHGRNSIDGTGGNIISLFNVSESNGTSMGNAFWNGAAMWYGNGDATFFELARGLDVGGHEMTHGVIEKTANLEYQYESGALNESFADVFAVCIDTLNWKIGEDVVRPGATPNNCLRDMQFPNNGSPSQPKHVSEQFQGTQDNGGVHINSGIPNRAFYLFATHPAVGRTLAEKVYYEALTDYLVKSSQFVDCRLAVIEVANKYGAAVANAAAAAFTTVGIVGNQGGDYLGLLSPNPGISVVACTNNARTRVDLFLGGGAMLGTLYNAAGSTIASRPSASDNGQQIVFCTSTGHIIGVDLVFNPMGGFLWQFDTISFTPVWRNVAISKDGRFIAALSQVQDNRIIVEDLSDPLGNSQQFFLYNPTYTTGQVTGEVRFADVLEFDYSGEYIMYDAYNQLDNGTGENLSYWDIGFLRFWENDNFTGPTPFISKLFSGLPPKSSVGNPVFSQLAPYVIAFDYIDGIENRYHVLGANVEIGEVDYLVFNNGELGWPTYTKIDGEVIYQRTVGGVRNLYQRGVEPNRITGKTTTPFLLINGHDWGRWLAIGNRSLMVDTDAPSAAALQLTAAPNPTTGALRLSFAMSQGGAAQVVVSDLLGRTVQQRAVALSEGENQLELDLQQLPIGTYAVRLQTADVGATLKVVKQ